MSTVPPARRYGGTPAAQRAAERRERLITAGIEVFGTLGYRAATVEILCRHARLTKRYFYESFSDSEELFIACYLRCADEVQALLVGAVAEAPPDDESRLRAAIEAYFAAIAAYPERARITLLEVTGISPKVTESYRGQTRRFAESIEALGAQAFASSGMSPTEMQLVALGVLGATTTIATQWLLNDRTPPRAQVVLSACLIGVAILRQITQRNPDLS
ncbi:TetR/AcrR family transcriptional regulator [Gordonia sp. ABSL11-1]|uniref:TetR/AcrR family transcriptional regulator n=1 Tax=Gordonia sp. ABSL11-1 TaxID=3053924 RepID=UPI002572FD42|nr:TetR/AcrR family transcriptional regulator [Gordonia sp. ABSL11-1]MDL9948263.1 TetR/AcrR family transcriptional regulator [Gordonia sp. ABSL11-1]